MHVTAITMQASKLAYVHPDATIGPNVEISPFAYIEADVEIGEGSWIGPHAVLMSGTRLGKGCKVFPGAVLGAIPQDLKFEGEYSLLEVGDNTTIREYCTLNRGTKAAGRTVVGSNCLLMAYVHVAHDCVLGNHCILANNVTLAGHIEVGDWAILGGLVAVHQFVRIGDHVMIGGGSLVRKDVPPFVKAAREPLSYAGVNTIGLQRRGFSDDQMKTIQSVYRLMYVKNNNLRKGISDAETLLEASAERDAVLNFVKRSERGLMRGYRSPEERNAEV